MIFVLSRLFFFGVGIAAAAHLPPVVNEAGQETLALGFLDLWSRFDGGYYLAIATEGYDLNAPDRTAFFPLFPMLIRLGATLGGRPALWGMLVSLVATFFALYFLCQIAEKHWGLKVARATVLTFAFSPRPSFSTRCIRRPCSWRSRPALFGRPTSGGTSCSRGPWELWPQQHVTSGCFC